MDYHHVVEAAGVVSLGLIFNSYAFRWFEAGPARGAGGGRSSPAWSSACSRW